MSELKMVNVDEFGNIIENVDWSIWERVRTEEVLDDEGKVIKIISHCATIPEETLTEAKIAEAHSNLQATDYISAKLGDALLSCNSLEDILQKITEFKDQYSDVIAQRQTYRNTINSLS